MRGRILDSAFGFTSGKMHCRERALFGKAEKLSLVLLFLLVAAFFSPEGAVLKCSKLVVKIMDSGVLFF